VKPTSQRVVQELKEKLKEEAKKPAKRAFKGFKAVLRAETEDLALETEVRYAKMDSKDVDIALKVIAKSRSTGKVVRYGFIGDYHKGYITEDGEEIPANDVEWYQVLPDGEEAPVQKFERTKAFEILKYIPSNKLDQYFVESKYEIWSENIPALWKLAEWLNKHDMVAVARHSFGNTFVEYYALIYPVIQDGNFVLVMALTRMNIEYKHVMPIMNETIQKPQAPKKTVQGVLKVDI